MWAGTGVLGAVLLWRTRVQSALFAPGVGQGCERHRLRVPGLLVLWWLVLQPGLVSGIFHSLGIFSWLLC